MIYQNVAESVGNTPLIRLKNIEKSIQSCATILAKTEGRNPAGSAKDRVALQMILDAEEKGLLKPGSTIIEPTSGNTGIGLAAIAAQRGYQAVFTMPETMSVERQKLLLAYGAKLVLTEGKLGMKGAIAKAEELRDSIPNSFLPGQFSSPSNAKAHYLTTGPEIWRDTEGKVDLLICAVGTGGTITGTGRFLKEKNPRVKLIAVEPTGSPVLSGGKAGPHGIQGIGAGFIPEVLDVSLPDGIQTVSEEEAYEAARDLARSEGILAGISSGAALHCAIGEAKKEENRNKVIVVILPDCGERYLSTPLFSF